MFQHDRAHLRFVTSLRRLDQRLDFNHTVPVPRLPFPRLPSPVSRLPFPVSRLPFPVPRLPFPVPRFPFPDYGTLTTSAFGLIRTSIDPDARPISPSRW